MLLKYGGYHIFYMFYDIIQFHGLFRDADIWPFSSIYISTIAGFFWGFFFGFLMNIASI